MSTAKVRTETSAQRNSARTFENYQNLLELRQKLVRLLEIEYPALWIGTRHHRNTNNQPLDFSDKPYLLPIYQDKAEEIVIVKCVQAGITEWLICDTLSFCDRGAAVFYVLPTQPLRNTFVPNRISKLRDLVPYYGKRLREIKQGSDSSQMKHFGRGTMKLVV